MAMLAVAACGGSSSRPTLPSVSRSTTSQPQTSSTSEPPTSTSVPVTPTITADVSTTSRAPITTNTTVAPTTTTTTQPPTTTTTTPTSGVLGLRTLLFLPQQQDTTTEPTTESDDAATWAWVLVLATAVGLLIFCIAHLVRARAARRRGRARWREEGPATLEHATTTAGLLADAAAGGRDELGLAADAVRRSSTELERLAASAPDADAAAAAKAVASSQQKVLFDLEQDALLRGATAPAPGAARPSADPQLVQALGRLRTHVERTLTPDS